MRARGGKPAVQHISRDAYRRRKGEDQDQPPAAAHPRLAHAWTICPVTGNPRGMPKCTGCAGAVGELPPLPCTAPAQTFRYCGKFLKRMEEVVMNERWIRAVMRGLLAGAIASAPLAAQVVDSTAFAGLRWREVGPFRGGRSDRKSTRLNSSHIPLSRMPSSA